LNADAVGSAPDPPPATASAADLQIRSVISGYMVRAHRESGPVLRLQGRGSGHGVGLCQHGAEILAQRGLDARKILEHYYQEFELRRLR